MASWPLPRPPPSFSSASTNNSSSSPSSTSSPPSAPGPKQATSHVSSLDILQPQRNALRPTDPDRHPDAAYLEDLSSQLIDLLNTKDHRTAPVMAHVAERCISEFEGVVVGTTREEHIVAMEAATRANPRLRVEVSATASVFHGKNPAAARYATVWVFLRATNYPYTFLWSQTVKFFAWEKREDRWECVKHVGFRGLAPLDGADWSSDTASTSNGGSSVPSPASLGDIV